MDRLSAAGGTARGGAARQPVLRLSPRGPGKKIASIYLQNNRWHCSDENDISKRCWQKLFRSWYALVFGNSTGLDKTGNARVRRTASSRGAGGSPPRFASPDALSAVSRTRSGGARIRGTATSALMVVYDVIAFGCAARIAELENCFNTNTDEY